MTADPNCLMVLLAGDNENRNSLLRAAFKRLAGLARLTLAPDREQLMARLKGHGCFADRAAWPLPDVLILQHAVPQHSALHLLCWLRGEQGLSQLPVVILSPGFSPSDTQLIRRLNAASCLASPAPKELAEAVEDAICEATRLSWEGPLHTEPGPGPEACMAGGGAEGELIRVWT